MEERSSCLSATLINNHWRVDASIYMERRCAGGSAPRRHLVLINESGNRFWYKAKWSAKLPRYSCKPRRPRLSNYRTRWQDVSNGIHASPVQPARNRGFFNAADTIKGG